MRRFVTVVAVAALVAVAVPGVAGAHTETDLVAVPAGSDATVTLKPTHGCGDSPTVKVRIRTEVAGATAGTVDGWTSSATTDAEGRTVLEWSGGSLPSDATGAFGVHFRVPDTPGKLLLFPAIQECANGDDYAWIQGDPDGEAPAPRLLVLPAGSHAAATIDEVPADAPGRDQLTAVVDVDDPNATPPAAGDGGTSTSTPGEAAAAPSTTADTHPTVDGGAAADTDPTADGGGSPVGLIVTIGLLVAAIALSIVGMVVVRRQNANARDANASGSVSDGEGE